MAPYQPTVIDTECYEQILFKMTAARDTRVRLIALLDEGYSISQVTGRLGMAKTTALRWALRYLETRGVQRRRRSGRPRVLTGSGDRALLRHRERNPFMSANQLRHASRFSGGRKTVGNRLKAAGIRNYRAAQKQTLTEKQAIDRLAYCNSLHGVDWRTVIFTDESQMLTSYAVPVRVYREAGQRHSCAYVAPNPKQGRISVKFWWWMSRDGAGMLQRIDGTLRTHQYIYILEHVFYPSALERYPDGPLLFLQDNYAIHKSMYVQRWLSENPEIEEIALPPVSPDLNVIEYALARLKE